METWASKQQRTIQAKADGASIDMIVSDRSKYHTPFKNGSTVYFEGNMIAFDPSGIELMKAYAALSSWSRRPLGEKLHINKDALIYLK